MKYEDYDSLTDVNRKMNMSQSMAPPNKYQSALVFRSSFQLPTNQRGSANVLLKEI